MEKPAPADRKAFFAAVRASLFDGALNQGQVTGLSALLDGWETGTGHDARQLAYILATAHHETGGVLMPVIERGGAAYFTARYETNAAMARRLGNTTPGDGARYCGRGFVQITGRANYRSLGQRLGEPLEAEPDRALDLAVAVRIILTGMMSGAFTGRRLPDYFTPSRQDWLGARRIVNGSDRAVEIARLGKAYWRALTAP